jgi:hypothetical protein
MTAEAQARALYNGADRFVQAVAFRNALEQACRLTGGLGAACFLVDEQQGESAGPDCIARTS